MPVIRKPLAPESAQHRKLVAELAAELQRGTPTGPKIVEEEQRGGYLHVTVIWDAWKKVEPEERGRIIMDAYEQQRPADVTHIAISLGLTPEEADRLCIQA